MVKENYLINEAAKEVHVESHVLRYWEDELELPIRRNVQGHRIYTQEDIDKLIKIKELKDKGLQLKAVKTVLSQSGEIINEQDRLRHDNPFSQKQLTKISKNGEMKVIQLKSDDEKRWKERHMIEVKEKREIATNMKDESKIQIKEEEKVARVQYLMQKMIQNTLETNNKVLIDKISNNVKQDLCKELDYQFRLIQEQEDQRMALQEEHYKKLDELLRDRMKKPKQNKVKSFLGKKKTD